MNDKPAQARVSLSNFLDEEYAFLDKYIAVNPLWRQMFMDGKVPPFMADCLATYKAHVLASVAEKASKEAAEKIEIALFSSAKSFRREDMRAIIAECIERNQ